jgi:uncharacterized membrane protein YhaH (DUF805 family)
MNITLVGRIFSFSGRANRTEFWLTFLLLIILVFLGSLAVNNRIAEDSNLKIPLIIIFLFIYIWIEIAVMCRRFNDLKKSRFWILIMLVPYIGAFVLVIWLGFYEGVADSEEVAS